MTVIETLLDLQDVDGRIRELEHEEKDLPRRIALERARLSGVNADLLAAKATQQQANERVKSLEAEAMNLDESIRRMKTSQIAASSNKEYQQISQKIDMDNHDLEALLNNAKAAADDLPSIQTRIDDAQARFDAEKGGVDEIVAEFEARLAEVKAELEAAKAERAEKAKAVNDPKMKLYYERLRTKRWPVVVPLTVDGVCDGCHLVQPPSVAQLADANSKLGAAGRPQVIVACTMCGRILYRD